MKIAFNSVANAATKVKNFLGDTLTGKGWAIFGFIPAMALLSTVGLAPAAAASLGVFEGTVKTFLAPVFASATYTQGIPILGQQILNTVGSLPTTISEIPTTIGNLVSGTLKPAFS